MEVMLTFSTSKLIEA